MPGPSMPRSTAAYRSLETAIVTLELEPASLVTERQLIERIGLGRTPVREALQRLAWEGLIEIRPRAGVAIADIRPEDYGRVIAPRVALEPMAARAATRRAQKTHALRLEACAEDMLAHAAAGDVIGFLDADKAFDDILDAACPNPFLVNVLGPLRTHSRRLWFRFGAAEGPARSARLHTEVMRAVAAGDEALAGAAMRELMAYLQDVADALLVPV